MSEFKEFTFKPAILRPAHTYRLYADRLAEVEKSGRELWSMPFADMTGLRYADMGVSRSRLQRLEVSAGKVTHKISFNSAAGALADHASDFFALRSELATALGARRPDLPVALGEGDTSRWIIFGIGAVGLAFFAFLGLLGLSGEISGQRLERAILPLLVGLVFCGSLFFGFAPWRKPAGITAEQFAEVAKHLK